ncbi:hypothetical protein O3G_MSEX000203 [Manduca sexta]|nr:hypothetical protein O3G_MSEX000203 [Manduca sexta]
MGPPNDGEDPGDIKKRKYAKISTSDPKASNLDKYKIFIKPNYKRLFLENGTCEYIVYVESTENEKVGNKNPITLTNLFCDNVKGIIGVHRINALKIGVSFKTAGAANSFLKMEDFLLKNKLKAFIPSYLTEKMGVLRYVPKDMSNEEIYRNISCDSEIISIKRMMRKVDGILTPMGMPRNPKLLIMCWKALL